METGVGRFKKGDNAHVGRGHGRGNGDQDLSGGGTELCGCVAGAKSVA